MWESLDANSAASFLNGGGEMGERMRSFDWSRTPLGPAEAWPQSLKTAVRIMLTSRQPFWLGWGEQLIKLYNDPYKTIVGGKHPDALGQPVSVVWREIWDDIGPMLRTALGGVEGTYVEEQLLIMERNGYPEETYYTFSYSPIPNDDGSVGGIICANTDDTRRVIGERQLALLRELAAKTADARTLEEAFALGTDCLATNPHDLPFALVYLVEPEERRVVFAGRSCGIERGQRFAPEEASIDKEAVWPFAEVLSTNRTCLVRDLSAFADELPKGAWDRPPHQAAAVPIPAQGREGEVGILVVGLSPYRLFDDDYRGFLELAAAQIAASIANAQAYEEERRRAEALAELDRAKTAFFSNVSHEFRTPLTLMLGPMEDLLQQPRGALRPEQREQLEVVHRNAMRLLRQVNTLLDVSRIITGKLRLDVQPVELREVIQAASDVVRPAVEAKEIRLQLLLDPNAGPVSGDPQRLQQVVWNLLSNAVKFTPKGGRVQVRLERVNSHVEVIVSDTGEGIEADFLPHVFERFRQADGSYTRRHGGLGLGLAIVRHLVELHGGTVSAQSNGAQQGSTFTVTLPLIIAKDTGRFREGAAGRESSAAPQLPPINTPWLEGLRLLLVEDERESSEMVRLMLEQCGATVASAASAAEGFRLLTELRPDVLVSDIEMPGEDGYALIGKVRSLGADEGGGTHCVALTAHARAEDRLRALAAGFDAHVPKPVEAAELATVIATFARRRRNGNSNVER